MTQTHQRSSPPTYTDTSVKTTTWIDTLFNRRAAAGVERRSQELSFKDHTSSWKEPELGWCLVWWKSSICFLEGSGHSFSVTLLFEKKAALSVPPISFFMLMQGSHGPPQISMQTCDKLLGPGEGREPSEMPSSCSGVRRGAGRITWLFFSCENYKRG